jgi:hypothetical protein
MDGHNGEKKERVAQVTIADYTSKFPGWPINFAKWKPHGVSC